MTKGQRRARTQTLHISSFPISLCTSQDPLGKEEGVRGEGGAKGERKKDRGRREEERQLSTLNTLHTGIAFLG